MHRILDRSEIRQRLGKSLHLDLCENVKLNHLQYRVIDSTLALLLKEPINNKS